MNAESYLTYLYKPGSILQHFEGNPTKYRCQNHTGIDSCLKMARLPSDQRKARNTVRLHVSQCSREHLKGGCNVFFTKGTVQQQQ